MPSTKRSAGDNINRLGQERHQSALLRYALAVAFLVGTVLLFVTNSTSYLGWLLSLAGFASSYYLYRSGRHLTKRAGDAQRGAKAEKDVAALLRPLQRQGWYIEYNLKIRRWGDADLVLHSLKAIGMSLMSNPTEVLKFTKTVVYESVMAEIFMILKKEI